MTRGVIHLIAPAGSCGKFLTLLGTPEPNEFLSLVQDHVGPHFSVTGNEQIMAAEENEETGGRNDDLARARDIQTALADSNVVALVTVRGGAWFSRILRHIDFTVLNARTSPIAVFGFSELTTLVNIVAAHSNGRGVYDMGPAFLPYGLRRYAMALAKSTGDPAITPKQWAADRLPETFRAFWSDIVAMIRGQGSSRAITTTLVRGDVPDGTEAVFTGGNLVVLCTLVGTPFQSAIRPDGRWLVLEEINEKSERIDRYLANLTLAGFWHECEGVLLGDFHMAGKDLGPTVESLLSYHLPDDRRIPIMRTTQIGHIWPMSPLPLHSPVKLVRISDRTYSLDWSPRPLQVV